MCQVPRPTGLEKCGAASSIQLSDDTAEVRAIDEFHSSNLCATPWHRAPHRHRALYILCFSDVYFKCSTGTLKVFHIDVANVDYDATYVTVVYTYVASFCSQCFICFSRRMLQVCLFGCCICFKYMLHVFYLDVAYVFTMVSCVFEVFLQVY
jgi:hypothetical protein